MTDELVYDIALIVLLVSMAILLIRAFRGPTVFDRILAVNSFGTKTVLLIAVTLFLVDRLDFLDLARVYALLNFIGTIAVMRFTLMRDFKAQDPEV